MDFLLEPGFAIYVAMLVALSVWLGIFIFLWRIDQRARKLQRELDTLPATEAQPAPRATLETRKERLEPTVMAPESRPIGE